MTTQTFLLYLATWSLVALAPGPAVMCSMAQSARYGFRPSLAGISGIQLGNFLFFVCIAFGLGALLTAATTAFAILRVLGAIYLFYLGTRIILGTQPQKPRRLLSPCRRNAVFFFKGCWFKSPIQRLCCLSPPCCRSSLIHIDPRHPN